jgi:phosphatidate phosphatase APP1
MNRWSTCAPLAAATLALLFVLAPARASAGISDFFEGSDETFVVFPTYAAMQEDGSLVIPVRAWVYEPEEDSIKRELLVEIFEEALGADETEDPQDEALFEQRIRPFLYDNEGGKDVTVRIGDRNFEVGETDGDGHVTATLNIPLEVALHAVAASPGQQSVTLTARAVDKTRELVVPVIPRRGVSVVSDIDDTIKKSEVLDRQALVRNTFMEPFEGIDGMAAAYRRVDQSLDATFHYLSASPWQLYPFLAAWMESDAFPAGSFHLRQVRPSRVKSVRNFVESSRAHKISSVETMIAHMPERSFILIGDSGEHDPEVYGELAREHSDRIDRIYIRQVEGADNAPERFEKAFSDVPPAVWLVFDDATAFDSR